MTTDRWVGELMEKLHVWFESAAKAKAPTEANQVNQAFPEGLKAGAFPGEKI